VRIPRRDWPQWKWIRALQPGDVIESPTGNLRIVRSVTHCLHPRGHGRVSVSFVINRCSWTHRPYTTLCDSDLTTIGYRPIGLRIKLDTEFDEAILREIGNHDDPEINCCDVRGIA